MRKIMIVGAGQAGLQLGISLLKRGYRVSITSNRTPEDLRTGKVLSSQCMFHDSLQLERDRGLNFWEPDCPPVEGISFTVPHPELPGEKAMSWGHRLDHKAQSVDQRVKVPGWMAEFSRLGGELLMHEANIDDLERWTQSHDLVIVAAGKGAIAQMFERDAARSPYDKPQRALALTYVHGMAPRPEHSAVNFNLIPGVGEYFVFPALTVSGPCEIMVFEGVPGGPMDCWGDVATPAQHLARSKEILGKFLPWEAARCTQVELTDANGILAGRFAPTVRQPVGQLPGFAEGDASVQDASAQWAAPRADRKLSFLPLTEQIQTLQAKGNEVALFQANERTAGATVFYTHSLLKDLQTDDELNRFLAASPTHVALIASDSEPAPPLKVLKQMMVGRQAYYFVGQ